MEPVAPASQSLGPSEIAKDWAARGHPVSRQYVDRLIRIGARGERLVVQHDGTEDGIKRALETAWLFRTQRTDFLKSAKGGRRGPDVPQPAPDTAAFASVGRRAGGDDLDAMLERVRGVEMQAFARWMKATGYDQAGEAKAYAEAAKTRTTVEALVAAHHRKVGLVVNLADAQVLIDQRLAPLRDALHGLDKEIAKELFPEDPAPHRRRIRRVIARQFVTSLAIARAKKPLVAAAARHVSARAA